MTTTPTLSSSDSTTDSGTLATDSGPSPTVTLAAPSPSVGDIVLFWATAWTYGPDVSGGQALPPDPVGLPGSSNPDKNYSNDVSRSDDAPGATVRTWVFGMRLSALVYDGETMPGQFEYTACAELSGDPADWWVHMGWAIFSGPDDYLLDGHSFHTHSLAGDLFIRSYAAGFIPSETNGGDPITTPTGDSVLFDYDTGSEPEHKAKVTYGTPDLDWEWTPEPTEIRTEPPTVGPFNDATVRVTTESPHEWIADDDRASIRASATDTGTFVHEPAQGGLVIGLLAEDSSGSVTPPDGVALEIARISGTPRVWTYTVENPSSGDYEWEGESGTNWLTYAIGFGGFGFPDLEVYADNHLPGDESTSVDPPFLGTSDEDESLRLDAITYRGEATISISGADLINVAKHETEPWTIAFALSDPGNPPAEWTLSDTPDEVVVHAWGIQTAEEDEPPPDGGEEGPPALCRFDYTTRWPDFYPHLVDALTEAICAPFEHPHTPTVQTVAQDAMTEALRPLVEVCDRHDRELETHLALRPCCECEEGGY